nr:reverse transcriptase domain-containing protein [Tanacetum cinerariifolium]
MTTRNVGRRTATTRGGRTGGQAGRGGGRTKEQASRGGRRTGEQGGKDDRNVNLGNGRNGCSYKEFMACKLKEFDGKGRVVANIRWVKKM